MFMPEDPPNPEGITCEEGVEVMVNDTDQTNEDARQNVLEENCIEQDTAQLDAEADPGNGRTNGSFLHGLLVGFGISCIATFAILWFVIFFTPLLPSAMTYENLLAVFVYPLIYLLAIGLVTVTAGIVREYYSMKK